MDKTSISFILPSLSTPPTLDKIIGQLVTVPNSEIVLINQTGRTNKGRFISRDLKEIVLNRAVSASHARNIGASCAVGKFLFFLDDDAEIDQSCIEMIQIVVADNSQYDFIIVDRCYFKNGVANSYNPSKLNWSENHWNQIKYITEWNICINANLFQNSGGFLEIGVGSNHPAQSGEIFILFANMRMLGCTVAYDDRVKIIHPKYSGEKPLSKCLAYYYGAGFSVGYSIRYFNWLYALLWAARTFAASIRDLFETKGNLVQPQEYISWTGFKLKISYQRAKGFICGLLSKKLESNGL